MMKFHCIKCGKKLECPDSYAGRTFRCPSCKESIQVPEGEVIGLEQPEPQYEKIYCVSCGSSMPKQSLICIKCGTKNPTIKEEREYNHDRYRDRGEDAPVASWVIVVAYLLAVLMPIMGFILGIVLLCRKETGHGIGALILSIFSAICWASVYA